MIAASGTITQLIPPSLVLIVLADQLGRSVGDMYAGAIGPSVIQVLLFCLYVLVVTIVRPGRCPRCRPRRARCAGGRWRQGGFGMVPSLVLIFLVLGTILLGLATPTEAGAMGAVGALVLAWMQSPPDLAAGLAGHEHHHADHRHGGLHPGRLDHLQPGVPGRRRRPVDRDC